MSKLNQRGKMKTAVRRSEARQLGTSGNGNIQFVKSSVQALFELVVSTLYGADKFYESGPDTLKRCVQAIDAVLNDHGLLGAEYAARLFVFARTKLFMRTMPIVMTVELGRVLRNRNMSFPGYRHLVRDVISRADELKDMYAYALKVFGDQHRVPVALRRGIADAFNKFDAYQFAKWTRQNSNEQVTFQRLLRIVHPTPKTPAQNDTYARIMDDTLTPPYTWEVISTLNGMLPAIERKTDGALWDELVSVTGPGSMGYTALLRNLRNIADANCSISTITAVTDRLTNEAALKKARVLPWEFLKAYKALNSYGHHGQLREAVSKALDLSMSYMPDLGPSTWIILDVSLSMSDSSYQDQLPRGSEPPLATAALLAVALYKSAYLKGKTVTLTTFSDSATHIALNPTHSVLTLYSTLLKSAAGGGTDLQSALRMKTSLDYEPSTVIVLSDMEINASRKNRWGQCLKISETSNRWFDASTVKVAVNFNASQTTPLDPRDGWLQLAGWSERIFNYVDMKRNSASVVRELLG